MIQSAAEYNELDPEKKDEAYAKRKIEHYITQWQPLISEKRAQENMAFLFGNFKNEAVRAMFGIKSDGKKKDESVNVDFRPLKMMEKVRNIIVAENEKAGIHIEANATDPTATTQKQKDRELLKFGGDIEAVMTLLGKKIKKPPFKIADQKDLFNGNAEKFQNMGLDSNSDEDLDHFMTVYYRLRHEMKMEELIQFIFKFNEVQRILPKISNDIIAKKAVAMMAYVDDVAGPIKTPYLAPETVYWIPRKREDGKDAVCKGVVENVTIGEFLERIGNGFDWDEDWQILLNAVNMCGRTYTGIGSRGGKIYGTEDTLCDMGTFITYNVSLGYIEWKETNVEHWRYTLKTNQGNPKIKKDKKEVKPFPGHTSKYNNIKQENQVVYSAYFIYTVGQGQIAKLFKYGKVPYQQIEGSADEIANYTIRSYVDTGSSAVEIAIPHLLIFEKLFKKYDYLIDQIKPPGVDFDVWSIVESMPFLSDDQGKADVYKIMEMFTEGRNRFHVSRNGDGEVVGGDGQPHKDIDNGLKEISNAMAAFRAAMDACIEDINGQIGISPVRDAYSPSERDGFKLQMQSLEYSRNATGYVSRIINTLFTDVAYAVNNYVQYIVNFKDINRRPYDFILNGIGDQSVEDLQYIGKVSAHRYSIFLEPTNAKYDRERIQQYIDQAFVNGQIKIESVMLLSTIESPKKAMLVLAYETNKALRMAEKQANAQSQRVQAQDTNKMQLEIQLEKLKGQNDIEAKRVEGQWLHKTYTDVERIKQQGVSAKLEAIPIQINAQKNADMETMTAQNEMQQPQATA